MTSADIVVLAGGDTGLGVVSLSGVDLSGAAVIAADSGVHLADAVGLSVDVAVGDFDSIAPERLADMESSDRTDVRRHPSDKDATDLALALDVALELAPTHGVRVLVAGIEGTRPDFVLANQLVVASDRYRSLDRRLALVGADAWIVTGRLSLRPPPGTTVSLVPVGGPCVVSFAGVRWPLDRATLEPGTTWALSNESTGDVDLRVHSGTAMLFELGRRI